MSSRIPANILVIAVALPLAVPVSAQRYQARDHHVFHPPIQPRHQSVAPAGSATQTRVAAAGNSSATRHDATLNASRSNDAVHTQTPPGTDSVHPHENGFRIAASVKVR